MLSQKELEEIVEEFLFWEENFSELCINKKVKNKAKIPKNKKVTDLLKEFEEEHDYYSMMHRRALVRKKIYDSFLENIN